MSELRFDSVSKVYSGTTVAVDDLDLTIEDGEFVVLVGPSGCGKTTTLEMIAGLQKPTSGDFTIDNEVVNEHPPQERGIAMVFQNYALYPHKTVRENITFGLKYTTDLGASERDEKAREVAELLGIEQLLDDKPKQLSGGQQQRVALGRAIVRDPEVFLLDEPLSNLDAKLRTEMRAELQQLQKDLGVTTVYVTHDQTEAMTMGDRIAVLNRGVLQQIGEPTEVYNEPSNEFVANFIGSPSINFVPGHLEDGMVTTDHVSVDVTGSLIRPYEGDTTLGIRPQDLRKASPDEASPTFTATVRVLEKLGSENVLHLDAGDLELVATVDESVLPGIGDSIELAVDEERVHVFDDEGKSIKYRYNPDSTDRPRSQSVQEQ
ncbi:ABC transporter ATP-binding protein [Haloferax marisrubri]|uniref:ABC-type D-xylose/L-arabinose transporter n=1 Tax=Haloferax marisrubri TaxID=1544719 RepID=A0A2P4NLX7_9EURY|nr:ABC transporter ATP-binding protein [Haloferax marisrubri]POG54162.1 ABC transporter ATP-binding protein [Haloferax marisrubri]